jgi:hypothetical protein
MVMRALRILFRIYPANNEKKVTNEAIYSTERQRETKSIAKE